MIFVVTFFFVGAIVGGQINHAIYRFSVFRRRPISPWIKVEKENEKRTVVDYIPILGWTFLNREEPIHGNLFWVRPFLIELGFGFALVGLYIFHIDNSGLTAGRLNVTFPNAEETRWIWFAAHATLLALLTVATFIDFDEFIIPDQVTIPGVLIFVVWSAITPQLFLPNISAGRTFEPLGFASPSDWPSFAVSSIGLLTGLFCIWFWCFALIPKTFTMRKGIRRAIPLMIGSILQTQRKTNGKIPTRPRRMYRGTWVLGAIAIFARIALIPFWTFSTDTHKISLLTSLIGMLFGMSMIWSIRIIGKMALGKEAMGFGDVTLMAMVGAYMGWQACLPILAVSAFAALFITVPMLLIRRGTVLPYGPYLSIGTIIVILCWPAIWENYLKNIFQVFGVENVFIVLAVMTVPMFILLAITRFVKERVFGIA